MKKVLILFLVSFLFSGCCTTEYIEVPVQIIPEFEPVPERTELSPIEEGETLNQFLLRRVNYYSALVKEWESWGISVYESVDLPLPESLLWLKTKEENTE